MDEQNEYCQDQELALLPGVPLFASLFLPGKHYAQNSANLTKIYGYVFQVHPQSTDLGQRFIYANFFDSVKELWIKKQKALISRPTFWTFHNVVSKMQGVYTLGTSPWNESVKRARKAAATALNRQAVHIYLLFIDLESTTSINELRFSLNISLALCYGIRIDGTVRDHTLNEAVQVERELGNIRGIAHNWQLFEYILDFYEQLKQRMANGADNPCIAGNVLKDTETTVDENELKSICLTMVAAGLDTLPGNINLMIAYLSPFHGQEVQEHMYKEIIRLYPNEDPWDACLIEGRSEFVVSSVKNMWAANHDAKQFHDPMEFIPNRFVGISEAGQSTQHQGDGASTRMCAGAHLTNRELYVIFIRLVLAFHIHETTNIKDRPILHTVERNSVLTSMVTPPKPFKGKFIPRNQQQLEKWIASTKKKLLIFEALA
ncbi:putative cytochrome P450 phenylacetate 2-hydroxylase [Trichoderma barbatum]